MFESRTSVAAGGTRVFIGHTSKPEIQVLEDDGNGVIQLRMIVRWTAELETATDADVAAERTRITESLAELEEGMRRQLLDPQIDERKPVASTFPVFSSLHAARDGRLWVRTYRKPWIAGTDEWVAIGSDGRFECRADIPEFAQLAEVGSDYLLAVHRDDLGVERVLRYGMVVENGMAE